MPLLARKTFQVREDSQCQVHTSSGLHSFHFILFHFIILFLAPTRDESMRTSNVKWAGVGKSLAQRLAHCWCLKKKSVSFFLSICSSRKWSKVHSCTQRAASICHLNITLWNFRRASGKQLPFTSLHSHPLLVSLSSESFPNSGFTMDEV